MRLGAPTVSDLAALLFCAYNNCKCFVMTKLTSVIMFYLSMCFTSHMVLASPGRKVV